MVKKTKNTLQKESHITTKDSPVMPAREYAQTLSELKRQVQEAQLRAAVAANKELAFLYWSIGKTIVEKENSNGWGTSFIEHLAKDLQNAFPGIAGFSRTNVFRMKAFFSAYSENPTAVGQLEDLPIFKIPWGHNAVIIEKVKSFNERLWYAQKTIEYGWSRSMLDTCIKSNLYRREGKAITNFSHTLTSPQSNLAQQSLKDPYLLDFLRLDDEHLEKHLEKGLIAHMQKFLTELGQGFAFVGRQYHVIVSGKDYYIDLLFYNFKLHCFVVVELKACEFIPEYAGKINFYLSAVDDALRSTYDNPTIGLILCKSKDNLTVEYALRKSIGPIGVASYETQIVENLPKELKGSLPTIEEIEAELEKQDILLEESAKQKKEE